MTNFQKIYDCFLNKITDDMYLEWTKEDTQQDLQNILLNTLPYFEFPNFRISNYQTEEGNSGSFEDNLTLEEINILAVLMVGVWIQRQLTSIEHTRMKFSGSDFKMTSQANHLSKLLALKRKNEDENIYLQRLYHRRRTDKKGQVVSNWGFLLGENDGN